MLQLSRPLSGTALGECVFMRDQPEPLLTLDSKVYLKSGSLVVGEAENYPEAYSQFSFKANGHPYEWVDTDVLGLGIYHGMLTFGNGVYLLVSGNADEIYRSTDRVNWTQVESNYQIKGLVYAFNLFVALERDGNSQDLIRTSPDGITWTTRSLVNPSYTYVGLCLAGSTLLAMTANYSGVTPNNVATSTDGITWTARSVTTLTIPAQPGGVVAASIYAFCTGLTPSTQVPRVFYATTSPYTSWSELTALAALMAAGEYITSAVLANGLFVVTTNFGKVFSSPNLSTWTRVSISGVSIVGLSVVFANNEFVAVGLGVYTSFDGITWVNRGHVLSGSKIYIGVVYDGTSEYTSLAQGVLSRAVVKDAIGIKTPVERGGSPLYMRIK